MKKIFHVFLSAVIAFLGMPLVAFADKTIATPPMFVTPIVLNHAGEQLKKDALNQERSNSNEEATTKVLVQENTALINQLKEQQGQLSADFPERVPGDLYASIQTLDQLKEAMENYNRQLDERNRQMIASNEQNIELRERIKQAEDLYQKAIARYNDLEASKASGLKQQDELISRLEKERDDLLAKNNALMEQERLLADFKSQLIRTKKELEEANRRYKDLQAQGQTSTMATSKENSEQLVDVKAQLASVKEELQEANHRYQELQTKFDGAVKLSTASMEPSNKDQSDLIINLRKERDALIEKIKSLDEQQKEFLDVKNQSKEELKEANRRYQELQTKLDATAKSPAVIAPIAIAPSVVAPVGVIASGDQAKQLLFAEKELKEIKIRFLDLQEKDKAQTKVIEKLKQDSQALNKIMGTLKSETVHIQKSQMDLKDNDTDLSKWRDEILKKDGEIAQLKMDLAAAHQELAQVKESLVAKDKILTGQQESINHLGQEMGEVKQNFSEMQGEYARYDSGFDKIREKISELKNKLATAQARASLEEVREQELIKLKGELAALNYQLQTSQEDSVENQVLVKKLNTTVEDLTARLESKSKDLQENESQLGELKKQAVDGQVYQRMVKKLRSHIKDLAVQVNELREDVAGLLIMRERESLYETLVSKYRILDQLTAEKAGLLWKLVQKRENNTAYYRDELKKTVTYWQELNTESIHQLENLKDQAQDKQKEVADLEKQLKESQVKVPQLESMLDVYQKKAEDKDLESKKRADEMNSLSGDLIKSQEVLTQREEELKQIKAYFYELEKKSSDKAQEIREKSQQVSLLNEMLSQKDQNIALIQKKLAEIQEQSKSSAESDKIISLNSSMEVLEQRSVAAENKLKEALKQNEEYRQDIALLNGKIKEGQLRLEDSLAKQFLQAASDESAVLKISLKDKEVQIDQLKKDAQGNVEIQRKLDEAKAKVTKLMEDLYFKDKEIQRLKMQGSSQDQTIKPMGHEKVVKVLEEKTVKTSEIKKDVSKNKEYDRTDDLKAQLKQARIETENAKAVAKDKNNQIKSLGGQIKKLNEKIHNLENKVVRLNEKS